MDDNVNISQAPRVRGAVRRIPRLSESFPGRADPQVEAIVATELVADFGPRRNAEQNLRDVCAAMDRDAADGLNDVAFFDASFGGGRIGDDVPGGDAGSGVHPGDAIVGLNVAAALLEVQERKNDGRNCKQGEKHRTQSHSQAVIHTGTPTQLRTEW